MDVDWCLCGQRVKSDTLYCSTECRTRDCGPLGSSDSLDESTSDSLGDSQDSLEEVTHRLVHSLPGHNTAFRWAGNGRDIAAWANDIPFASKPAECTIPIEDFVSSSKPTPPPAPSSSFRRPQLLRPASRPLAPTLCMSSPPTVGPHASQPITTLSPCPEALAPPQPRSGEFSSLTTAGTFSIATPPSDRALPALSTPQVTTSSTKRSTAPKSPPTFGCSYIPDSSWLSPSSATERHHAQSLSPSPSPAPTHKPSPTLPRRSDSMYFTILAKAHPSSAFRVISSPESEDDSSDEEDGIWWLSTGRKAEPLKGRRTEAPVQQQRPRGRRLSRHHA